MFEKQLALIKNPVVKRIAEQGVTLIPEYFYKVPASSTGKYHPAYALGDGGLYRHVQAAVAIAVDLFRIKTFTEDEQDIIVASLILHDGWKQGLDGSGGHTTHSHPLVARDVLLKEINVSTDEEKQFLYAICENISSHMGQWTTSNLDKTVLPFPNTNMQMFVHECDYLASRKDIEVKI
jgi:hypothetical protein